MTTTRKTMLNVFGEPLDWRKKAIPGATTDFRQIDADGREVGWGRSQFFLRECPECQALIEDGDLAQERHTAWHDGLGQGDHAAD